ESLASQIQHRIMASIPDRAWTMRLDKWGRINWLEYPDDPQNEVVHNHEPRTILLNRLLVRLVCRLPFEWLL
ncbi:phospholipase D family protein, partial [Erwinia amylovora]|nr:phospholipase D family protein [Erwinia amylovora]